VNGRGQEQKKRDFNGVNRKGLGLSENLEKRGGAVSTCPLKGLGKVWLGVILSANRTGKGNSVTCHKRVMKAFLILQRGQNWPCHAPQ